MDKLKKIMLLVVVIIIQYPRIPVVNAEVLITDSKDSHEAISESTNLLELENTEESSGKDGNTEELSEPDSEKQTTLSEDMDSSEITEEGKSDAEDFESDSQSQEVDPKSENSSESEDEVISPSSRTGDWGSVHWTFDQDTNTITVQGGTAGIAESSPWRQIPTVSEIVVESSVVLPERAFGLFSDLTNLKKITNIQNIDTSQVSTMGYMFSNLPNLEELDLSGWDVSNVSDMSYMFAADSGLHKLDLSGWDVSNLTNTSFMFFSDQSIERVDLSEWNTLNLQNTSAMFANADSLKEVDMSGWNTSNFTNTAYMFSGAKSLTSIDLSNWNTSNIGNMTGMFSSAEQLSEIKMGSDSIFDSSAQLPLIRRSGYTGRWIGINTRQTYNNSTAFLDNYDGAMPDTFVWEVEQRIGNIVVRYVDTNGNDISDRDVFSGESGSPYVTFPKEIPGWYVAETPSNASGTFTEEAQEVVYVYERSDAAPVTVKYQDSEGNQLAEPTILSGKVGLPYESEAKEIPGWYVAETPSNASGTFTEEAQEVVYVYERSDAAPITVKYQDSEGNQLAEPTILSGKVGLPYESEAKEIPGWYVAETPSNASGTFTEEAQEVVYVYERSDAAPITVKYQDSEGNQLAEPTILSGKVGLPYESEAKEIPGWYVAETPSNASGTFTEEAQEVVYVYERSDAAPVTVKYQDSEGNQLAEPTILSGKVGLPYESEAKEIPGWYVAETPSNASGTFTEEAQEVVYVYERSDAAPVTVKYQDSEGNQLAEPTILSGKVGLPYESEAKEIPGWYVAETPSNASGTFTEEAQEVVYVYERSDAAPVTVKYQDSEGNQLAEPTILSGKVGLPYESEAKEIPGWYVAETPSNASGTFTEEAQEVVYVYERSDAAPVTVKYQDSEGNQLAEPTILSGKVGLPYESEAKEIPGWYVAETPSNASGTFTEEAQEVVYVYERSDAAPVTVKYQDSEGNQLAEPTILSGKVGLPYESEAKEIPGWYVAETPSNASGTFTEEAQEVVYVYERSDAAPVTVKYQDSEGNQLAEPTILSGKVGLPYESEAKEIPGWYVAETPSNASGTFTEEAQEVVYVYERSDAAPVTVKYQDSEGNQLAEPTILSGKVGLPYESEAKEIPGWYVAETPSNASGTFTEEAQEVVYVYERSDAAPVTVKYQDSEGNQLAEPTILSGKVGLPYESEAKEIPGWYVAETPSNASGTFTEEAQEVVYVYERSDAAPVTVKYQDSEGNQLAEPTILSGKVGLPYESEAKEIPGWYVAETPSNASGTFTEEAQEVVYVYERSDAAPITVKYQDSEGNQLAEPTILSGKVGLPYESEAKEIPGWYVAETPSNASGTFTEEAQEVVYVYERSDAAPVTVKYQDSEGNQLAEPTILSGKVGLPYESEAKEIPGWYVAETPSNASGTFTEEAQEVVYVYERSDAAPVTVKYQDSEGNQLAEPTILSGKVGLPYESEAKEIPGWYVAETPSNASGTFTEEAQEVVYVYERSDAAPVTVKYQDSEGNQLAEPTILSGKVGLPYESEAKEIPGWYVAETPSNASGTFTEEAQEVVYVYERSDAAPVTVKYQDSEGNQLAEPTILSGKVGLPYESEAKEIPGWYVAETPSNASGTFTEEAQEVAYVYERSDAAPVTVKYQDSEGNQLAEPTILSGKVGLPYESEAKEIPGWYVAETPSNASGTFTEEAQEVVYVYERSDAAPVTVKYQDSEGNQLAEPTILSGKVGLPYESEAKEIPGWYVAETPSNASGTFTEEAQEVAYVYERSDAAPVTVKYQDSEGNQLAEPTILSGKVGLPYESEAKEIPGWYVAETPSNASGTFTEEAQEVVYVYERSDAAPVTVKYQDSEGNQLAEPTILSGKVGLPYESEAKEIPGWYVAETPSNASGTFTEEAQEVVYVYEIKKTDPQDNGDKNKNLPKTGEYTTGQVTMTIVGSILVVLVYLAFKKLNKNRQ